MNRDARAWCALTGTLDEPVVSVWRHSERSTERVWTALTRPRELAEWFADVTISGETYEIETDEGDAFAATLLRYETYRELFFSWKWDAENVTVVHVVLHADGTGTMIRVTDTHVARGAVAAVGASWDGMLAALVEYLDEQEQTATEPEHWEDIEASAITLSHDFPVDEGALWTALTTADGLRSWWWPEDPGAELTFALQPGARFRISAPLAGVVIGGEVIDIVEPEALSLTWRRVNAEGIGVDEAVQFALRPTADGTRLYVRHTGPFTDEEDHADAWQRRLAALADVFRAY